MSDIKERLRLSATGMCGQGELDWASMCQEAADHIATLEASVAANQKDAERYRKLRQNHWSESDIAVVCHPRQSVKLGSDCPSGDRLDEIIDISTQEG